MSQSDSTLQLRNRKIVRPSLYPNLQFYSSKNSDISENLISPVVNLQTKQNSQNSPHFLPSTMASRQVVLDTDQETIESPRSADQDWEKNLRAAKEDAAFKQFLLNRAARRRKRGRTHI